MKKATFGAGCFWGVEAKFLTIKGVTDAVSGYEGGRLENPTYDAVCSDKSGHAEVVEVTFDPSKVTYDMLLDVFFSCHNPTTLNRQGPDVGTQYRSVIFYHDDEQRKAAEEKKKELANSGRFKNPIVTFIEPATKFYPAEDYHQRYYEKNGIGSCHI